jgi:sugar lactone lactonase YvrE
LRRKNELSYRVFAIIITVLVAACSTPPSPTAAPSSFPTYTPYPTYTPRALVSTSPTTSVDEEIEEFQERPPFGIEVPDGYTIQHILRPEILMPTDLAIGPSGEMYATEFNQHRIMKISADGTITTYLEGEQIGNALATDSEGNLFVEEGDKIVKFLPTGEEVLFASDISTCDLAVGPSGDIFTTSGTELIRFTPDGRMSVFSSEIPGCGDIAVGPSGNVYLAYFPTGEIIKVDLEGHVSTLASGFAYDAFNIAFDNEGRLYQNQIYFTEVSLEDGSLSSPLLWEYTSALVSRPFKFDSSNNAVFIGPTTHTVVRVSLDGERVECLVDAMANSDALAISPSGDLFMGPSDCFPIAPGKVTRISPSGEVSVFVTGLAYVKDIVFDLQGNAYISEMHGGPGRLLKVTPDGTITNFLSREGMELHSLAYDVNTGDILAFEHLRQEILRISPEGLVEILPLDFGEKVNMIDLDFDTQGNLIGLVVFEEGLAHGPVRRGLFRIAPDNQVSLIVNIDTELAGTVDDVAVSPSGEIYAVGPEEHPIFRILRITPDGQVSVFARNVPYDILSVAVNQEGEVFFTCSAGLFKISKVH